MAGLGSLFKLVGNFNVFGSVLNNRAALVCHQQHATLKQATKERLKELNIPTKPKKPLTPYFRFMRDYRPQIMQKNPGIKMIEIAKQCSTDWVAIDSATKYKYAEDYRKDMEEYTKTSLNYSTKLTNEQRDALKMASKEKKQLKLRRELKQRYKEAAKPKRPINAFMQYALDQGKQSKERFVHVLKSIKGKWQTLPDSDKQPYYERYEAQLKAYNIAIEAWKAKMIKMGNTDLLQGRLQEPKPLSRIGKMQKDNDQ